MKIRVSSLCLAMVIVTLLFYPFSAGRCANVVPKGQRRLGISVQPASDGDYGKAFAAAKSTGMQSVTLSLNWDEIEPIKGHYDDKWLDDANVFYPASNTSVDLIIRPIDSDHIRIPDYLEGKSFASTEMIARFDALLDNVFSHVQSLKVSSLAVGNEVDSTLKKDPAKWAQYTQFYDAVSAYARHKRPGLQVGVVIMFQTLTGTTEEFAGSLNRKSDVIFATYYPLNSNFTVKNPSVVKHDWNVLCASESGRPIVMTEVGCPSSVSCGSSLSRQAQFVREVFAAWDQHPTQIRAITYSWLTDLSPAAVIGVGNYYGFKTDAFSEFIRTLGLRTYPGDGTDKPSFIALKQEAKARGW
jgi:hypothetical protein